MAEIANENLETDVYHLEETDDGLTAESLTVITEEIGNGENGEDENRKDKDEKNGFVTFSVPMVSNYWTIGSKNMKNKLLKNA